jgi:WD40 repeat protein
VRDWLRAKRCPGLPLVITAQPGAGKSSVLARVVLEIERTRQYDGVAFHASSASIADFVDAVSAACDVATPSSWQQLITALAGRELSDVMVVAVDALDEAASDQDRSDIRRALRELSRLEWLRVAVATRPLAARYPYSAGSHLNALGVLSGADSRNLVDLDAEKYFTEEDLIGYASILLAQEGFAHPGPPSGAWERYRHNKGAHARLARLVAQRADRNYLVAGISALQLGEDDEIVDPASTLFDITVVPSGIGEALSKYLDSLSARRRHCDIGLLTALAYRRGPGLDDERWLAFARVLGYTEITMSDLAELKESGASDYLLETSIESGELVTQLFHQALADELLARRDWRTDEARIVRLLQDEGELGGWPASSSYSRNHAPSHAAAAGLLEQLVQQAGFLVGMAPSAMMPSMRSLTATSRQDSVSIYEMAFPLLGTEPSTNSAVLELISWTQGNPKLAEEIARVPVKRPYKISGNIRPFSRELARFDGHTDPMPGVVALSWPSLDHSVIVTASWDGTARVWDPLTPDRELARFDGHTGPVSGLAVLDWPELDHQVVVTTSHDGTARVWDPLRPDLELGRFNGHDGHVNRVAALDWPGLDHQVLVTTSDDGTARVWDPLRPERELARFDNGDTISRMWGVAALDWPGLDHQVLVTTSQDGIPRIFDPLDPNRQVASFDISEDDWERYCRRHHGTQGITYFGSKTRYWHSSMASHDLARFHGHRQSRSEEHAVWEVTTLSWPGLDHSVIATTSSDETARVWDPMHPDRELARFDGHTEKVWGVAVLDWPGLDHPVIATTSDDETVRVWDPMHPNHELARFDGHINQVWNATTLDWPGLDHRVVVTVSADLTARVWDAFGSSQEGGRFNGHTSQLLGVARLDWPGLDRPVIVTTSADRTARVWDPLHPDRELARFDSHTDEVWGAAPLSWPGLNHSVIVTASKDGTARVWDPLRPDRELARFEGHSNSVWRAATLDWPDLDHPVIVTTSADRTARVWDPLRPDRELARFEGHRAAVGEVATMSWPGLEHQVIVTTSPDETARVWDPLNPGRELARFTGHASVVVGVATLSWPTLNHQVIATTSLDRTVRIWDPLDPDRELARFDGHRLDVLDVAVLDVPDTHHQVLVTVSRDCTARVWDPQEPHRELARIPLFGMGHAIAAINNTTLAIASTRGFLTLEINARELIEADLQI